MIDDTKSKFRVLAAGAEKSVLKAAEEVEGPKRGNWFVKRIVPLVAGLALVGAPVANISCSGSVPVVEDADAQTNVEGNAEDGMEERDSEVDADESEEDVGDVADAPEGADVEEDGNSEVDADESEEDVGDVADAPEDGGCTVREVEFAVDNPQPDVGIISEGGSTQTQVLHYWFTEYVGPECEASSTEPEIREIEYVFNPPLADMDAAIRQGINTSHVEVNSPIYRVIRYDAATRCITYSVIVNSAILNTSGIGEDVINDGDYNLQLRSARIVDVGGTPRKQVSFDQLIGTDYWNTLVMFEGEVVDILSGNQLMPTAVRIEAYVTTTATLLRPEAEDIIICNGETVVSSTGVSYIYNETASGWAYTLISK